MSKQKLTDDKAAQICWKYLHGEYDEKINATIHDIAYYNTDKEIAITMIFDIAYRIGYAKSELMLYMSETTYKIKKKLLRNMLATEVNL